MRTIARDMRETSVPLHTVDTNDIVKTKNEAQQTRFLISFSIPIFGGRG